MAFYLVVDGQKNAYGEADSYVVRARGRKQALSIPQLLDPDNATVERLEDGKGLPNAVVLASLIDFEDPEEPDYDPYATYSF